MKKHFTIIASICFISLANLAFGQDKTSNSKKEIFPKYSIGYTSSALLNRFPGLQISQDFRISNKLAFTSELALTKNMSKKVTPYGYRIKLGIQKCTKAKEHYFYTVGANIVHRKSATYKTSSSSSISSLKTISKSTTNSNLLGVEITQAAHYNLSNRLKLELGYGIGIGNKWDEISTDKSYFRRSINSNNPPILQLLIPYNQYKTTSYNEHISTAVLITSFHINLAYTIIS